MKLCAIWQAVLLIALWSALGFSTAWADEHFDQDTARQAVESGLALPYGEVQSRLRRACECRILEAKLHPENEHGRRFLVYEIKAISDHGEIVKLEMDAASGEILHMKSKGKAK